MGETRVYRKSRLLAVSCFVGVALSMALGVVAGGSAAAQYAQGVGDFFAGDGLLKSGDKGSPVSGLQDVLSALGYYQGYVDGVFGPLTESAVLGFQEAWGLYADGLVGPKTRSALMAMYQRKNPPESHTVRSGETLSSIAERYGVSVASLQSANGIKNQNRIYAGQVLAIKAQPPDPEAPVETGDHAPGTSSQTNEAEPEVGPVFPAPTKGICLTFDDGPDLAGTLPILTTLDNYGIRATFFVIGERAQKYPDLIREMVERGHTVGIHGYEHKPLAGLPASQVAGDLKRAQDAIYGITGLKPRLFRPPGGYLDRTQVAQAARLGLSVVMWTNIGGADLGCSGPEEVVERVVASATDGGIILLHEGLPSTLEALPSLIESLARLGYGFRNPPAAPY